MRKRIPPVWLCALLLMAALCWRMVGAPVTAEQLADLKTPLWQARVLLPSRLAKVWLQWFTPVVPEPVTMDQEAQMQDAQPVWLNVYDTEKNQLSRMTLQGYVCGVVAAEMPAAYHVEALKAQAVAARTRVLAQMNQGGCSAHPGADICTDSAHCQGYATLAQCRERWQDGYEAYRERILTAEAETRDQLLTYEGEPITVLYHAISGGRTEDAQTVFAQAVPYLVSVESSGEESARGFREDLTIPFEEMAQRLNQSLNTQSFTAQNIRQTLAIGSYTDTGRVKSVQVGSTELSGTAFRSALGLRSTWFSITMDDEGITFHQQGYGHGVGMSQVGANSMAANGASYAEILLHYYPGVTLEKQTME